MSFSIIYVTAGSRDEALKIARGLVEARLAACANVFDGATSVYWWEGAVQQESEAILVAKTRTELVDQVVAKVKELHSYSCPCVVALPIGQGNPDYLAWLGENTL